MTRLFLTSYKSIDFCNSLFLQTKRGSTTSAGDTPSLVKVCGPSLWLQYLALALSFGLDAVERPLGGTDYFLE